MTETAVRLLIPEECALLLVDQQAGLAFGVGSHDRQMLLNNAVALAKTARTFGLPVVACPRPGRRCFLFAGTSRTPIACS